MFSFTDFSFYFRVKKDIEKRKQRQQKSAESKQKANKESPTPKASTLESSFVSKPAQDGSPTPVLLREESDRIRIFMFFLLPMNF